MSDEVLHGLFAGVMQRRIGVDLFIVALIQIGPRSPPQKIMIGVSVSVFVVGVEVISASVGIDHGHAHPPDGSDPLDHVIAAPLSQFAGSVRRIPHY